VFVPDALPSLPGAEPAPATDGTAGGATGGTVTGTGRTGEDG
jgi:hypothetical protein